MPKTPREVLAELRREEPSLHGPDDSDVKHWRIGFDILDWLVDNVEPGAHTIETGCGYSTIQFAAIGTWHTVVSPLPQEHDRVRKWCEAHDVATKRLVFDARASEEALPQLSPDEPLDLVLVDGAHAFPWPYLDWFYTADLLRQGGRVIVDDTQLRAPRLLAEFLREEKGRWVLVREFDKTAIFEKLVPKALEAPIWRDQPWGARPLSRNAMRLRRWRLRLRRIFGRKA